jgi:hypothetical protein
MSARMILLLGLAVALGIRLGYGLAVFVGVCL